LRALSHSAADILLIPLLDISFAEVYDNVHRKDVIITPITICNGHTEYAILELNVLSSNLLDSM
jgi:hypothetical protein